MPGSSAGSLEVGVPYRPAPEAPRLPWPGEARIALWVVPNVEWFDLSRPVPGGAGGVVDARAWSLREYGNRVGIWRLMEMFDRLGIRATVALNAQVCDAYPAILRAGASRGWEWMGHGLTNTDLVQGLDEGRERAMIAACRERIARETGAAPVGWLTPHFSQNGHSARLLRESGIEYVADWMVDDRPFAVRAGDGWLVGLPYNVEVNDKSCYENWRLTPAAYRDHLCGTFDVLYREGGASPTTLAVPVHTYLSGYPARAAALEEALRYMRGHDGVWWTVGGEIARLARAAVLPGA